MAYALILENAGEERREEFLAELNAPLDPFETYDRVWAAVHAGRG